MTPSSESCTARLRSVPLRWQMGQQLPLRLGQILLYEMPVLDLITLPFPMPARLVCWQNTSANKTLHLFTKLWECLNLLLLLAQWDLFVLKPEAAAPCSKLQLLWLCSSMFPVTAVKWADLAVALINCCSFCSNFSHLIDQTGWFHHRKHYTLMAFFFLYRQELFIFFHYLTHCIFPETVTTVLIPHPLYHRWDLLWTCESKQ